MILKEACNQLDIFSNRGIGGWVRLPEFASFNPMDLFSSAGVSESVRVDLR